MDFKEYSELFHAQDYRRDKSSTNPNEKNPRNSTSGGKEGSYVPSEDYKLAKKTFDLVEKNIEGYLPATYFRQRYYALRNKYLTGVMTQNDSTNRYASRFVLSPNDRSTFNAVYNEASKNQSGLHDQIRNAGPRGAKAGVRGAVSARRR